MKQNSQLKRLIPLLLAFLLTASLLTTASAASSGMGNFGKVRDYPGFSDVSPGEWYARNVQVAYEMGLINGKSGGKFDPQGHLTVAEAVTLGARVHATYYGNELPDGGTPWYANAVRYAIDYGIIQAGDYIDYTVDATRADLANLFYCIPAREFPRINRVSYISDISSDMDYFNFIYLLYGAGVLTGSDTGAFQPNELVTRAEAAAIINRVVVPENREHTKYVASSTKPGSIMYNGANGNFRIGILPTWKVLENAMGENGFCSFECGRATDNAVVAMDISVTPKTNYAHANARTFAEVLGEDAAGREVGDDIEELYIRGWKVYYLSGEDDGVEWELLITENSTQFYIIKLLTMSDAYDQALYDEMLETLYTLDIAL